MAARSRVVTLLPKGIMDTSANDSVVRALRASAPFEALPDAMLAAIAAIGHRRTYRTGETIYEVGSPADRIYLILGGQVEHSFDPGLALAADLVKIVGQGAVFGWAALLKGRPDAEPRYRLARTVSLGDADVLIIDAAQLMALLDSNPPVRDDVMARFTAMVRHLYGFAGFVKVGDHFVPAAIPSSDPGTLQEYETFAF